MIYEKPTRGATDLKIITDQTVHGETLYAVVFDHLFYQQKGGFKLFWLIPIGKPLHWVPKESRRMFAHVGKYERVEHSWYEFWTADKKLADKLLKASKPLVENLSPTLHEAYYWY